MVNYANSAAAAEAVCEEIKALGGDGVAIQADMSQPDGIASLFKATAEAYDSPVGVLVNNAGITRDTLAMRMKQKQWEEVIDCNLNGVFYSTQAAAKVMMKARTGRIVNIASVLGLRGGAGRISYAASKFAVVGLTQALAGEVAARGVRVNCICPSSVRSVMTVGELMDVTGMTEADEADALWTQVAAKRLPLGRSVEPEDIGRAVVWLCESDMVTGVSLPVTGGEGLPKG